jgi:hypothetical protein
LCVCFHSLGRDLYGLIKCPYQHVLNPGGPWHYISTTCTNLALQWVFMQLCCVFIFQMMFLLFAVYGLGLVLGKWHAVFYHFSAFHCSSLLVRSILNSIIATFSPYFFTRKPIFGIILTVVGITASMISAGVITYVNYYPADFPMFLANVTLAQ